MDILQIEKLSSFMKQEISDKKKSWVDIDVSLTKRKSLYWVIYTAKS
jgi:hypothetical protein